MPCRTWRRLENTSFCSCCLGRATTVNSADVFGPSRSAPARSQGPLSSPGTDAGGGNLMAPDSHLPRRRAASIVRPVAADRAQLNLIADLSRTGWQSAFRRLIWLLLAVSLVEILVWPIFYRLALRGESNEALGYWFFSDYHFRLYGLVGDVVWLPAVILVAWGVTTDGRRLRVLGRVPPPMMALALFGLTLVFLPDFIPHPTVFGSLIETSGGYVDVTPGFQASVPRGTAIAWLNSELRSTSQQNIGFALIASSVFITYLTKRPVQTPRDSNNSTTT